MFLCFQDRFADVDIRVRVNGGGHIAQVYAIRQALSKALVAYYQKCKFNFISKDSVLHYVTLFMVQRKLIIAGIIFV